MLCGERPRGDGDCAWLPSGRRGRLLLRQLSRLVRRLVRRLCGRLLGVGQGRGQLCSDRAGTGITEGPSRWSYAGTKYVVVVLRHSRRAHDGGAADGSRLSSH